MGRAFMSYVLAVERELVQVGTGKTGENKRDKWNNIPFLSITSNQRVDEKVHEGFCDTLSPKSGIHL